MHEHSLQAVIRRKGRSKVKFGDEHKSFPNILNQEFTVNQPCKKLATDITYIPIPKQHVYLSVLLDMHKPYQVLAYKVTTDAKASLSIDVVKDAISKYSLSGSMIHSDQGIHYTNSQYSKLLQENGIIQSMSRKGCCWDNAVIENFFSHFKTECVKLKKKAMRSLNDVIQIVDDYIHFYNNFRITLA